MNIDDAKEYLKGIMESKFRDKTFCHYINESLPGDFAVELAEVFQGLRTEVDKFKEWGRANQNLAISYGNDVDELMLKVSEQGTLTAKLEADLTAAREEVRTAEARGVIAGMRKAQSRLLELAKDERTEFTLDDAHQHIGYMLDDISGGTLPPLCKTAQALAVGFDAAKRERLEASRSEAQTVKETT